jgi:large subunit ribosomal protein L4
MDVQVKTLAGEDAGTVTLPDETFGLEPRVDLIHRVVRWQLARRQQGTHKAKRRDEVNVTGKKMYKQKGTGRARHSDKSASQFRGGAHPHGPRPRSHAHDLPKKVRVLGLKHALSAKAKAEGIFVLDRAEVEAVKTKALRAQFEALGLTNALVIDGAVNEGFAKAARNIPNVDVLPLVGINVYDVMRRHKLVLTRAALDGLAARFDGSGPGDEVDGAATGPGASEADVAGHEPGASPAESHADEGEAR